MSEPGGGSAQRSGPDPPSCDGVGNVQMSRGMFVGFCPADYFAEVRPAASVQVADASAKATGKAVIGGQRCGGEDRGFASFTKCFILMVGAPRFELGTPSPPDWCANRAALRSEWRGL